MTAMRITTRANLSPFITRFAAEILKNRLVVPQ
jgi:hypothetical protein